MQPKELNNILYAGTFVVLIIAIGFLVMFILFYRSRKKIIIEKQRQKLQYLQELSDTKSEIQNETLNHIGRELHDNIGQLLAVAKIHTNGLIKTSPSDKLNEINNALTQSIEEVRAISHSLNADRVNSFGLIQALTSEVERIQKLQTITISSSIDTEGQFYLENDKEIMLYRIVQEFISNTLKYAKAKNLTIELSYKNDSLEITLTDDGIGFDTLQVEEGTGLTNIKHRAKLIGASIHFKSQTQVGTQLHIVLPQKTTYE